MTRVRALTVQSPPGWEVVVTVWVEGAPVKQLALEELAAYLRPEVLAEWFRAAEDDTVEPGEASEGCTLTFRAVAGNASNVRPDPPPLRRRMSQRFRKWVKKRQGRARPRRHP